MSLELPPDPHELDTYKGRGACPKRESSSSASRNACLESKLAVYKYIQSQATNTLTMFKNKNKKQHPLPDAHTCLLLNTWNRNPEALPGQTLKKRLIWVSS